MAKLSQSYETVMVLNPKLGEEGIKALVEKFKALISENATIDSEEEWGTRRLAYEIEDQTEGYYYLINFTSNPSFPAELDRRYKITDGVMRTLIVAREEEKPKAEKKPEVKE
ncbi:MAG: 30S ribosomal protein S6 [Provencibacterium sp.]|jgi:small subunit ribosomal protein S6|nr:30S ribosomal protein S6 [Provencibacterium sp.]